MQERDYAKSERPSKQNGRDVERDVIKRAYAQQQRFRGTYPDGRCIPEIVKLRRDLVVAKCTLYRNGREELPFSVAFASREPGEARPYEKKIVDKAIALATIRAISYAGISEEGEYSLVTMPFTDEIMDRLEEECDPDEY